MGGGPATSSGACVCVCVCVVMKTGKSIHVIKGII